MSNIGIVSIGLGNTGSLGAAIYSLGHDVSCVHSPLELDQFTHLVLPGVGAFGEATRRFAAGNWKNGIHHYVESGRPLLGICLGMQLLATTGFEGGLSDGLDIIGGQVKLLHEGTGVRLPHVGWNSVGYKFDHPVTEGLRSNLDFYFVHSYCFHTDRPEEVLGVTDYSGEFVSIVAAKNVVGTQFHPEKSQGSGLKLLESFCEWDGKC